MFVLFPESLHSCVSIIVLHMVEAQYTFDGSNGAGKLPSNFQWRDTILKAAYFSVRKLFLFNFLSICKQLKNYRTLKHRYYVFCCLHSMVKVYWIAQGHSTINLQTHGHELLSLESMRGYYSRYLKIVSSPLLVQ